MYRQDILIRAEKLSLCWITDIRQWRFNNKIMREARLIKRQDCSYFNINGVQIFALNQENAERKYQNLITKNRNNEYSSEKLKRASN